MSEHTSGEWRVSTDPDGFGTIVALGSVADGPSYFVKAPKRVPDDEVLPNARLIAAAPELLEALKMMHDIRWKQRRRDKKQHDPGEHPEFCKACAAIAKAEGEEVAA